MERGNTKDALEVGHTCIEADGFILHLKVKDRLSGGVQCLAIHLLPDQHAELLDSLSDPR